MAATAIGAAIPVVLVRLFDRRKQMAVRPVDKLDHLREQQLISEDEFDRLRMSKPEGSPSGDAPTMKTRPDCAEWVQLAARVCRFCGYRFDQSPDSETPVVAP